MGVTVETTDIETAVAPVGEGDGVGDHIVMVGERVQCPRGEVPERRCPPTLCLHGFAVDAPYAAWSSSQVMAQSLASWIDPSTARAV